MRLSRSLRRCAIPYSNDIAMIGERNKICIPVCCVLSVVCLAFKVERFWRCRHESTLRQPIGEGGDVVAGVGAEVPVFDPRPTRAGDRDRCPGGNSATQYSSPLSKV